MDIKRHGEVIDHIELKVENGSQLPDFTVLNQAAQPIDSKDLIKGLTLISVVPNINTRVCSIQTKKFNETVDQVPNVHFYTISTNTPAEQKDWCAAENVTKMQLLSDQEGNFGNALGIYVHANDTLARSIFIIDSTGKIIYHETLSEQVNEPNYEEALAQVQK